MTTTDAATMQAWGQNRYGGPDVVALGRAPIPRPGRGHVRVRVRATALASADVRVMRGEPLVIRAGFGLHRPRVGPGRDVAGTVVEVGDGASGFAVGDEVVGESGGGGLAEFVCVPEKALAHRPDTVDAVTAAALPLAGGTAWQALDRAGLGPESAAGRRVLVLGAGGGVGMFATQLAAARGATVTALASAAAHHALRGRGAAEVHDYRDVPLTSLPASCFDAVLVMGGDDRLRDLRAVVVDGGAVVLVSGRENRIVGPMATIAGALITSVASRRKVRGLLAMPSGAVTSKLLELAAAGILTPHLDVVEPFERAREALAHAASGTTIGKVVVVAR